MACPSIMKGIPGVDLDDEAMPMAGDRAVDVTPERPQLAAEVNLHHTIVEASAPEQEVWLAYNEVGEELRLGDSEGAAAAVAEALNASASSKAALDAVWANNKALLAGLPKVERIELMTQHEELQRALANPQKPQQNAAASATTTQVTSTTTAPTTDSPTDHSSLAPTAETAGRPAAAAPSAAAAQTADVAPIDLSPADHRFWHGESFAVACPKKGNAPDWRMYALALGPRIRQAWTIALLNQLARDNQQNVSLFEAAQGAEQAAQLKLLFAERREQLQPTMQQAQEDEIPFDNE
jgi:hypothetical protein